MGRGRLLSLLEQWSAAELEGSLLPIYIVTLEDELYNTSL